MSSNDAVIVDANVFLRFLVEPTSADTQRQAELAKRLFQMAARGDLRFTSNAAVLAEVVFILHSPNHYGRPRAEIADRLTRLLGLPGCALPERSEIVTALNRWQTDKRLSFVDCLLIEQGRTANVPVASFDRRVQRTLGDLIWSPPGDE